MTNYMFAIILPIYNSGLYLNECLKSIVSQNYHSFHIIAIDDGSTDNSIDILNQYKKQYDFLTILRQSNKGVSAARNTALQYIEDFFPAKFDYVAFIDSDDVISPNFLSRFYECLYLYNAEYAVCGLQQFTKKGPLPQKLIQVQQQKMNNEEICLQYFRQQNKNQIDPTVYAGIATHVFKWDLVRGHRFNNYLKSGEDQQFIFELLPFIHVGAIIPDQLYHYRLRKSSLSHSDSRNIKDIELFAHFYFNSDAYPNEARKNFENRLLDSWWQETRRVYETKGSDKDKKILKEWYKKLISIKYIGKLDKKYQRRFFLFSLGNIFLTIYFKMRQNKSKIKMNSEYFD